MADHPFDPHSDNLPQDELALTAHEALALVAGSSLGQFFECIPATVWMTDTDLKLTFAQGPILRDLDVAPEKVLGRTLQEIVLDGREDHPLIHGHLTALSGHATSVRIEWGGILYNARIAPLRDASGTIIGCVGSHQQIGWLPDDDGLLRESDMRLRRIIDSNMIGIAFGNDEGRITEANEAFLQLAGYTREDLVADGISWAALTPVEFHTRQLQAIDEVRATGRCTPFEVDLIRRDGRRVPVLVGGARLSARRREGVAFVLDISERREFGRRMAAELACADALLNAQTHDQAIAGALAAVCTTLDCTLAQIWRRDSAGELQRLASHGDTPSDTAVLQRAAGLALAAGKPQWSDREAILAVPMSSDTSLIVARSGPGALCPWVVETTQAIATRLQSFLQREPR
ncbi:MAG TPA: PAS domain S-box protein [Vicinamibacterales bacterium]|nr:PAS domain S-box protein [Vicinamibacterales bacterium]